MFYCGNKWIQNSGQIKLLRRFLGEITQNHRFPNVSKSWELFLSPWLSFTFCHSSTELLISVFLGNWPGGEQPPRPNKSRNCKTGGISYQAAAQVRISSQWYKYLWLLWGSEPLFLQRSGRDSIPSSSAKGTRRRCSHCRALSHQHASASRLSPGIAPFLLSPWSAERQVRYYQSPAISHSRKVWLHLSGFFAMKQFFCLEKTLPVLFSWEGSRR